MVVRRWLVTTTDILHVASHTPERLKRVEMLAGVGQELRRTKRPMRQSSMCRIAIQLLQVETSTYRESYCPVPQNDLHSFEKAS